MAPLGLLLVFTSATFGQPTQFSFDSNGNLVVQAAENISPPQILSQPQLQVAPPGALASFYVVAANARNLSYQWRFNGADLSGATNDALLLQNIGATNEGQYSVVLANISGSVTSAPAALLLDGDRDGLADAWELASFGNLNQYPTGDADGDGVSNRDEFLDGTSPTNSASARFRLTVLSNGGSVTVVPARLSYTNGEVVTLTATAFAPNTFRGWTGDTNTTSNPLSLIMTSNKTVFARQGSENLVWKAGNGDWHVASNWEPPFVPTTNDNVSITSSATVTINAAAECGSITIGDASSGPTLTGSGALTIYGVSTWERGTMSGSGRTIIAPGASFHMANAVGFNLTTRTLENGGTVIWTSGFISMAAAVITNRAGALFESQGAGTLEWNGGVSRFDNAGIVRKTVHTGTMSVSSSIAFNNYGAVEIQTGTLLVSGGGTHTGAFAVSPGATLNLAGATHTASAASSITGAGNFTVNGGTVTMAGLVNVSGNNLFDNGTANLNGTYICTNNTLTIAGGIANFNGGGTVSPTVLNFSSGTLGGSQMVTVLNQITWTGGTMTGTGRTILSAGVTLNLANSVILSGGRILENRSSILWTSADFLFGSGAILTNGVGALFEAQGAGGFGHVGGPIGRFDNAGTFRKSINPGTTTVDSSVSFNNYGAVEIQTGTLLLNGGGTHTGTFDVPAGTTLNLAGGTHNASAASSITGAGQFRCSGGTANLAGLVNVSGDHTFTFGTANLTGHYICTNNTLTIASGAVNFNGSGTVTPALLNLSGGSLGGSQVVTVLSQMNWTGGTMIGSGRTFIPLGAALNVASAGGVTLNARTLENGGTVLWTSGNINPGAGAVITNRTGALFEARGAGGFTHIGGAVARIDNAGTFRKSINSGTTTVGSSVGFNNYSAVEIQTGTLLLDGGGLNNGTITVPIGTVLDLSGGTFTGGASSSITGAGQFRCSGGTANLAGLVNVTGPHTFSGGAANLNGNYICTNSTLTISGGTANFNGSGPVTPALLNLSLGTLSGSGVVTASGVMNWTGGAMSGSGRTIIAPGATLNLSHGTGLNLSIRTLENGGTVIWTSGFISMAGAVITNRAGALFENRSASGLEWNGGSSRFDNTGIFRKTLHTGTMSISSSVTFNNYGTVEILSGIFAPNGGYTSTTGARLHCAIGGTTAGTGYGRLQVGNAIALNGALSVTLINGFVPATNDTFTVLTGPHSGTFANFYHPSNEVTMQMSNSPSAVIVRVTDVFSVPQPAPVPAGLISWWRAEGNALDSFGTNHGVLTNGATFATGQVGQTFALDGVNDYVQVPDAPSLRPASVTIETWVKFFATNGIRIILVKPLGSGTLDSYGLALQDGAVLAAICDNSGFGPFLIGPANTVPGQWYHLAYTFDDSSKQQVLYVNGTPVASGTANKTMSYDAQPVLLGADFENGVPGFFHHGQIDEASLYNRALTGNEIATIYNAGAAGKQLLTTIAQPLLLSPEISGPNITLTWTALSNRSYRVEFKPDLNLTNWTSLPGDILSLSNRASKLDALTTSNRFYRVRLLP